MSTSARFMKSAKWMANNTLRCNEQSGKNRRDGSVFDFEIAVVDMKFLDSLNENYRTSWDPTNCGNNS